MTVAVIEGVGAYLPKRLVSNADLEKTLDTNDEWIRTRTGITQRYLAADGELTSDLAANAATAALEDAGLTAEDIDLILVATSTPDETIPATAVRVQNKIGATNAAAFDLNAACSGFVYALTTANSMIVSGVAKNVLVIGAEIFSRVVDWEDRKVCVLFGDGAGAVVVKAMDEQQAGGRGIHYTKIYSDGSKADILKTTGGVSKTKDAGVLTMEGKEVFRHGVSKMAECVDTGLKEMGWQVSDIDYLVPHQANIRILQGVAKSLELKDEQVIVTVDQHANTSAASIPLALFHAKQAKKLTKEKKLVLTALGAGLTWGSCIIVW